MEHFAHHKPFAINGQLWIDKGDECFLGPGRIELLNAIVKEGSINAAAKKLGISYQQAWTVIEQMNRLSPIPIMVRKRGGSGGGGAEFTPYGQRVLSQINQIEKEFNAFLQTLNSKYEICF